MGEGKGTLTYLVYTALFGVSAYYLTGGYDGAKIVGIIDWVMCGLYGLIFLTSLALFMAKVYLTAELKNTGKKLKPLMDEANQAEVITHGGTEKVVNYTIKKEEK
jgi:hypothetical protein